MAGIIDGEGYIGIIKDTPQGKDKEFNTYYRTTVTIVNTNKNLIDWLEANLSGNVQKRKQIHNPTYEFVFSQKEIRRILPKIKHRLIIKKRQAEILLELCENIHLIEADTKYDFLKAAEAYMGNVCFEQSVLDDKTSLACSWSGIKDNDRHYFIWILKRSRGNMRISIFHEAGHTVFRIFWYIGIEKIDIDMEEIFLYMQASLVCQITDILWRKQKIQKKD